MKKVRSQKRWKWILGLPLVVVGAAFIGCRANTPEERADRMIERMTNKLDLTDVQKAKLEDVKKLWLEDQGTLQKQREALFKKLQNEVEKDALDRAGFKTQLKAHLNQMASKSDRWVDVIADFHASLDATQKQKIAKRLKHFEKGPHHGRRPHEGGPRGRRGPPPEDEVESE